MSKKAVDIVLLPPDEIMEICTALNKKAYERGECKFLLNKTNRLPHMTVIMGCMESEKQDEICDAIRQSVAGFKPIKTKIIDQDPRGAVGLQKTDELIQLQKNLLEHVHPLFTTNCTVEHLLEDEDYTWDQESRIWVNEYVRDNIGEKWWPHITTHNKKEELLDLPIEFIADRIALCHMGDRGTCREILFETKLKK